MLIRTFAAAMACLAVAAAPAQAQPSARQMELAKRYMAAANFENMVGAMTSQLIVGMIEARAETSGETVTGELKIALTESAEEAVRAMSPKFTQRILPVIASEFTEAELEAAVTYMESAAGQSFLRKSPGLMSKVDAALRPLQAELAEDMEARFCKKVGCEPARDD